MDGVFIFVKQHILIAVLAAISTAALAYLAFVNSLLKGVPENIEKLKETWTPALYEETYARLEKEPITVLSYKDQLPPKQDRRYVVVGGCGLVGGYIVLQLLARGQSPESIRIADFQKMHRQDMLNSNASEVEVVHTDISSADSTDAIFSKEWPTSVARLPLTVFHTAAVIISSDRTDAGFAFLERINIGGTKNVLDAARRAGADVFISTSSGSINIRNIQAWVPPWRWNSWPQYFVQCVDESDFFQPPRRREDYFCNYGASKAMAERIVCGANCSTLRTGTIRPNSGIYGHPTDNTVGRPMNDEGTSSWISNIANSFVHGGNCAIAHLHFEQVLSRPESASLPQAGRPFTVTDPNPPIQFQDLYGALQELTVTPFRIVTLQPATMLVLSHAIEAYALLREKLSFLTRILPPVTGDLRSLQPALFSIVSHVYSTNEAISKSVTDGGLGYSGVMTTLEGVTQQVLDWNREHESQDKTTWIKYRSSVATAEDQER